MADLSIDPRLQPHMQMQPPAEPGASAHTSDTPNAQSDREDNDGTGRKRQKLNLYKCEQCRIARKKCFPTDRVWPQKCQRCLQHKPDELECSEPRLNNRKRGPNLPKNAPRSKTGSSSEKPEPEVPVKESDDEEGSDDPPERPTRIGLPKRIKREHTETLEPVSETPQPKLVGNKRDQPVLAYVDLGEKNFRMLCLMPGRKEETVVCSFKTVSLDENEEYETISYYWGGSDPKWADSVKIELQDAQKPPRTHPVYIRNNLCGALKSLRHPTEPRHYWVDALCINRSNQEETNRQVAMKLRIFHNAKNLCFWLGEGDKAGLTFIEKILDLSTIDKLVQDVNSIDGWIDFVNLLKNVAFSRLWLVQEVTVAQNTTLHCGAKAIQYADFVDAVAIFVSCREKLMRLFRENGKNYLELVDRKITITKRFIDVTTNTLRILREGQGIQRRLSLEALVSLLTDLTCTDHRDRIFSVLALAKDGLPPPEGTMMESSYVTQTDQSLNIDYGKSLVDVYQDFVLHAITNSKSLDIICRRWASAVPERDTKLPTWVRPLQSGIQPPFEKGSERTDADSLVGLPHYKYYSASGNKPAQWEQHLNSSGTLSLLVKGFRIDTITKLGPRASEGNILYEWLDLGGCDLDKSDTIPDKFWKTLVGDRGPHGGNAPSWYHRALLYCLSQSMGNVDINTNRLIQEYEDSASLVVDFLRRVQSVIWNRKFLVCERDDWVGLAPMAAQVGDVICILYGCSVPVLLRPSVSSMNIVEYWSVVGECYVHGIMDGEKIKEKNEQSAMDQDEDFELR